MFGHAKVTAHKLHRASHIHRARSRRTETYLGIALVIVMAGLGGALSQAVGDLGRGDGTISSAVGTAQVYVTAAPSRL